MSKHTPYHQGRKRTTVEVLAKAVDRYVRGLTGFLGGAAQSVGNTNEADINRRVDEATGRRKKR